MSEHAKYAPSSMYLTVACPGWLQQAALLPPEQPTEATLEGDAAHWVAAMYAADNAVAPNVKAPNGVEVDEQMIEAAAVWVEALEGFPAKLETPVHIRRVHPTLNWGTPDARQWNPERKLLRLADYKYGYEFVDEFENWQMLDYAVGACDELNVFDDPDVTIEMTVVQPRYYGAEPIRTWTIKTAGLKHYAERMREAVRQAESSAPVRSGPHCTHCPARVTCHVGRRAGNHAIDFEGRPAPLAADPDTVGHELALVQEFIKRLEARESGLAAMAESMIKSGQRVPNFSLEQKQGRLTWTVDVATVEMSANMVGKSCLKPPALVTPTQAKNGRLLDTRVIAAYSDRPMGAFKLTRDSTKQLRKFTP
jgi:hypothetical protein